MFKKKIQLERDRTDNQSFCGIIKMVWFEGLADESDPQLFSYGCPLFDVYD